MAHIVLLSFYDRHGPSSGNGYPEIDKHADYELLYASENTTHTIVRFRRKQSTCDDEDWTITVVVFDKFV